MQQGVGRGLEEAIHFDFGRFEFEEKKRIEKEEREYWNEKKENV